MLDHLLVIILQFSDGKIHEIQVGDFSEGFCERILGAMDQKTIVTSDGTFEVNLECRFQPEKANNLPPDNFPTL